MTQPQCGFKYQSPNQVITIHLIWTLAINVRVLVIVFGNAEDVDICQSLALVTVASMEVLPPYISPAVWVPADPWQLSQHSNFDHVKM